MNLKLWNGKAGRLFAPVTSFGINIENNMTTKQGIKITIALDSLALALADHNHKWTTKQRKQYEQAVSVLGKVFKGEVPPTSSPYLR